MLFFPVLLTLFMLAVLWFDVTRYLIPNWINGVLLALWPAMLLMSPVPVPVEWWWGLAVGAAAFAVGFFIFSRGWMGGGDIKLLIVLGVWVGKDAALDFFLYTGLLGGVLAIGMWVARLGVAWCFSRLKNPPEIPRLFTYGEPLPYGVAIAVAFLIVLWLGKVPGMPVVAG